MADDPRYPWPFPFKTVTGVGWGNPESILDVLEKQKEEVQDGDSSEMESDPQLRGAVRGQRHGQGT